MVSSPKSFETMRIDVVEVIFSYHCCRVPEKEFLKAYKLHPRLKTKVNNFHRQMSSMTNSEEEYVAIRPEWTTVDRILARRFFERID